MKSFITNSFGLHDVATLCNQLIQVEVIFTVVVGVRLRDREIVQNWGFSQQDSIQFAGVWHLHQPPVVKSTLPELPKINRYFSLLIVCLHNIPLLNFVPSQNSVITLGQGRRRRNPEEKMVELKVGKFNGEIHFEVLANRADRRSECHFLLPVISIVQCVE